MVVNINNENKSAQINFATGPRQSESLHQGGLITTAKVPGGRPENSPRIAAFYRANYAYAVYAMVVCPFVCLSVCLSVSVRNKSVFY